MPQHRTNPRRPPAGFGELSGSSALADLAPGFTAHSSVWLPVEVRPTSVRGAIANLRSRQGTIPHASKLAQRLDELEEIAEEEAPDQAPIDLNSLLGFLRFLERNAELHLKCPEIVLTSNGQIRAEWGRVSIHFFAIRFIDHEDVQFVVVAPDPENVRKTVRGVAICSIRSVLSLAEPYRVKTWIQDLDER